MEMHTAARLYLPGPELGACVYLAIERDTRGRQLTDDQRFNYYPATPLPMISWIFEGELRMVETPSPMPPSFTAVLPRVVFSGPHRKPFMDKIVPLDTIASGPLLEQFLEIGRSDGREPYQRVEAALKHLWQSSHGGRGQPTMREWVQSLAMRAAFTKAGAGVRRAQRRIRDWTGQSHRDLQIYVRTERAMARATEAVQAVGTSPDLAAVAAAAGFADQSHLGREVRRVTGLSPGRLGELMKTDEAFWFYRLLSEHLQSQTTGAPD